MRLLSSGQLSIMDHHSENGVYVNGTRVVEAVLSPFDEVVMGAG